MPWYNPLSWNKSETETAPKTRLPRRNYQSAQAGRLLADFHGGTTSADREIRTALKTLRNRSRQLCRNNPYAARALQIYRTQVCGEKGLSLQVRARNVPTGNENQGPLDQVGNAAIESEWKDWTRRGICEVTGKHSWIDCQKLVVDSHRQEQAQITDKQLPRRIQGSMQMFGELYWTYRKTNKN